MGRWEASQGGSGGWWVEVPGDVGSGCPGNHVELVVGSRGGQWKVSSGRGGCWGSVDLFSQAPWWPLPCLGCHRGLDDTGNAQLAHPAAAARGCHPRRS